MAQGARLTDEQVQKVAESLGVSPAWRAAADHAGVHETTLWRYRQRAETYLNHNTTDDGLQNLQNETDPDYPFYLAVAAWTEARSELEQMLCIGVIGSIPKDWKAAHAMLKSGWPQDYSDRVELTGAGGGPVQISTDEARTQLEASLAAVKAKREAADAPREYLFPMHHDSVGEAAGDPDPRPDQPPRASNDPQAE